jgi:predicted secreted protein
MEALGDKEIEVAAHCLLNPHTRVKGLIPLRFSPLKPVIQLPCPEALYMGLERWAVTKNQLDVPEFRRFCRSLIVPYADLIEMLEKEGFRIKILGVENSPSCAVNTTTCGYTGGKVRIVQHECMSGQGIFMEELLAELGRRDVAFVCEEIKSCKDEASYEEPGNGS